MVGMVTPSKQVTRNSWRILDSQELFSEETKKASDPNTLTCLCIQFNPPNWGFYAKRLEPKLSQYLPLNSTPFLMHSLQIL